MFYFIVNPNAGGGRGLRVWNDTKKFLNKRHEDYEVYFTAAPGDARQKARELTENCGEERSIIAVGGDGTMNEVVDGLSLNCPIVLGYLPAGSGNDLGRSLQLPKNRKRLIRKVISDSYVERIDYGVLSCGCQECHNRRFMVSSGIGFDAAVCHDLLDSRTKDSMNRMCLGKLSYFMTGLREFLFARPVKGYILLDGSRKVEFNHILFISAHIHPYEGGGFCFAPQADPTDGKLAICVASTRNKLKLVPILLGAKRKGLKNCSGVRFFECREAHIHIDRPLAVHTDGESCRFQTDIDVRCVEKQLKMMV